MLLLDNSAWLRLNSDRLAPQRREQVISWIDEREIVTCLPFLLEVGYSARSAGDLATMMANLEPLPHIPITAVIESRARETQSELARIGHHRLPPIDLILAACAEEAGAGVLHYDRDYDMLAEKSGLQFDSVWLAPPGDL